MDFTVRLSKLWIPS